jgi:hypothetical protein
MPLEMLLVSPSSKWPETGAQKGAPRCAKGLARRWTASLKRAISTPVWLAGHGPAVPLSDTVRRQSLLVLDGDSRDSPLARICVHAARPCLAGRRILALYLRHTYGPEFFVPS